MPASIKAWITRHLVADFPHEDEANLSMLDILDGVGRTDDCRCGHVKDVHEHYRDGSDCSQCECRSYRKG